MTTNATVFDQSVLQPPVNIPVAQGNGMLTDEWRIFLSNLSTYLQKISQFGFQIPQISTADRDSKLAPLEGTQIYNLDLKKGQLYNGTAWETITSST